MVRICVVVTARPSYSRVRSLLLALQQMPDVELQIIVAASALLERYGKVVDVMRQDGLPIAAEIYSVYEGETVETTAKSTGALLSESAAVLRSLRPSLVVVHADRYEVLAAAQAASYQGLPVAHLQGGEWTGSIDDRVRHAITQLADVHLVSTPLAAAYVQIARFPHPPEVYVTGCPSIDLCVGVEEEPLVTVQELGGAGAPIDLDEPFVVVLQHPTTEHWEEAQHEMEVTLEACDGHQVIVFWPGNEAGSSGTSKAIRRTSQRVHSVRNLSPPRFLRLLSQASCLVGNSSVGIRECSYLGVPVVNIGDRQRHRERAANICDVGATRDAIRDAIAAQVAHGRYPSSTLYGDGRSGPRMAEVLIGCTQGNHAKAEGNRTHSRAGR